MIVNANDILTECELRYLVGFKLCPSRCGFSTHHVEVTGWQNMHSGFMEHKYRRVKCSDGRLQPQFIDMTRGKPQVNGKVKGRISLHPDFIL